MGLLDHRELMIVKGIGSVPNDSTGTEQPLVNLDLLSNSAGFSLIEWSPNIPSLKSGGVWADSSISDGRTLISGSNTNVTETIVLNLTAASTSVFAASFALLQRMTQDARAFWDTFYQIEPVYIRWWACGAPGPQFALIFNIDMDIEYEDSPAAAAKITLTIEREFGWRGVKPGGNPKEWEFIEDNIVFRQNQVGVNSDVSLITPNRPDTFSFDTTLFNLTTWDAGYANIVNKNFIDIPASDVPGDLPALLYLTLQVFDDSFFIARWTKHTSLVNRSGVIEYPTFCLNANRATKGTDTTNQADANASEGNRGRTTFATDATLVAREIWGSNIIHQALNRGRYMVFVRAKVSVGTTTCSLQIQQTSGSVTTWVSNTVSTNNAAGGTTWQLIYMGTMSIPMMNTRTAVSTDGLGILSANDIGLSLYASRTAGTGELWVNDIVLIPIDEGAVFVRESTIYDNTGYFSHGELEHVSLLSLNSNELRGAPLFLLPNYNNRLIFLQYLVNSGLSTANTGSRTIRGSIVPRWSGIRDK